MLEVFVQELGPKPNRMAGLGEALASFQLHACSVGVHRLGRVVARPPEVGVVHKKVQSKAEIQRV